MADSRETSFSASNYFAPSSRSGRYTPTSHSAFREDVALLNFEVERGMAQAFLEAGIGPSDAEGCRILEVGCGWGVRTNSLRNLGFRARNIVGIDVVPEFISLASQEYPNVSFSVRSGAAVGFPDGSFDCSIGILSLSAMTDRAMIARTLGEMCRVSRRCVVVIDNFEAPYRDMDGTYPMLTGLSSRSVEDLCQRSDVLEVRCLHQFWTTRKWAWACVKLARAVNLGSLAYGLTVATLAPHSHRVYLVRLREREGKNQAAAVALAEREPPSSFPGPCR